MEILVSYLLMCLIFGTTFVAIKVGIVAGLPPLFFAAARFTLAGAITLAIAAAFRLPLFLSRKDLSSTLWVGLSGTAVVFAAVFWAEVTLSPGVVATVGATLPMFTLLLRRSPDHKISPIHVLGIFLGLTGVALVLSPEMSPTGHPASLVAVGLLLVAELSAAWASVHAGKTLVSHMPPLVFNGYQMLFGGLTLLLASPVLGFGDLGQVSGAGWASLAYLVLVGSVVAWSLFYFLIAKTGPVFPATWTYIAPILSTLLGAAVLHEPLGPDLILGVVLVLLGAVSADLSTWKAIAARIRRPKDGGPAVGS